MAEIKEMKTEDIVKNIYNATVEALLATLETTGSLKETIIEAKHLTANINAVAKGFNADQVDGEHASTFLQTSFVDRGDPAASDFSKPNFTTDGNYHKLDLSSIVPAGAKAVAIHIRIQDDVSNTHFLFRKFGNANSANRSLLRTQVAGIVIDSDVVVPCNVNREIEYSTKAVVFDMIEVTVKGWWL